MVIIETLVISILVMFLFFIIRLLDRKKKEFLLFFVLYFVFLLFLVCLGYLCTIIRNGGVWNIPIHFVRGQIYVAAFYVPPTFLIAYLIYPFKIVKRNRTLIWLLLAYSLIVLGGTTLMTILVSFSNM